MKERDLLIEFGWWMREEPGVQIASVHTPVAMAERFLASRGVPSSLPTDTTVPQHLHPEPKEWFEVEMEGDSGPFPRLLSLRDAEAACWLLLDKHEAVYRVMRVDISGERTLVCLVPPGLPEA